MESQRLQISSGTVTISGNSAFDVLTVMESLEVTLAFDYSDANFVILVNGTVTDTNGVTTYSDPFSLSHVVKVQAVANAPIVDVGTNTKATVEENSDFVAYPVTISLADTDGSETYQSVVVAFSTPRVGSVTEFDFGPGSGITFFSNSTDQITLMGSVNDIEMAMAAMQVRPGSKNGEDITITVTATSVESNPTEMNNNGPGVAGDEIAVPTAVSSASFVIPVDPVIEATAVIVAPTSFEGKEDIMLIMDGMYFSNVGEIDTDGSEETFLEIDVFSYPESTLFFSYGDPLTTEVNGYLQIPELAVEGLRILPPPNFSGDIVLSIRGLIIDTTTSNTVTKESVPQELTVVVFADADRFDKPYETSGAEDLPAAFGATLATSSSRIRVKDDGSGIGNNDQTETISRVVLYVPVSTESKVYGMSGTFVPAAVGTYPGFGTGQVDLVTQGSQRVYFITSTIITGAADIALLSQADRELAEADIRATLDTFAVQMGPTYTDVNGIIRVQVETLDVHGGAYDTMNMNFRHTIRVRAVANMPSLIVVDPVGPFGATIPLNITVTRSADDDNSETLSVRITVPRDNGARIGTITGVTPSDVTLRDEGSGKYMVTSTGSTPLIRETALNSFLSGGGVEFDPRNGLSGSFIGTEGLFVEAISKEKAGFGSDVLVRSRTASDYIDIIY
jgi:hypothetical protein